MVDTKILNHGSILVQLSELFFIYPKWLSWYNVFCVWVYLCILVCVGMCAILILLVFKVYFPLFFICVRSNAEEALQGLNGSVIGKQTVRLSWGRNPANKQVHFESTVGTNQD